MKAEEYLQTLTGQIRCKAARSSVREEIAGHIEEQRLTYESQGIEKEEAEVLAVQEMGDPVETGVELDRIHRPRMSWGMIALAGLLSGVWIVLPKLLSAGNAYENVNLPLRIIVAVIGMVMMTAICYVDYTRIGRMAKPLAAGLVGILFLLFVIPTGLTVMNGGYRTWISLGFFAVDMRLILLIYVPLYAAVLYGYRGGGYREVGKGILWMLLPLPVAVQMGSVTTAVMLCICFAVIFTVAVCKRWYRVSVKPGLGGFYMAVTLFSMAAAAFFLRNAAAYQRERLLSWTGMYDGSENYVQRTVRTVLEGSVWFGKAETQAAVDILNHTDGGLVEGDFMLTEIAGNYGIAAALILVLAIVFLLGYLLWSALKQQNRLGMIMGLGCAVVLFAETALYVLSNLGMIYVAVTCPFVTYGYGGILQTYLLLGVLLSVYRYQSVLSDTQTMKGKGLPFRIRLVVEKA